VPADGAITITVQSAQDHLAVSLAICEDDPYLVLIEAHDRGLISDAEFVRLVDANLDDWDQTSLEQHEELCLTAVENQRREAQPPPPPPSLIDPNAPRAAAGVGAQRVVLSAESPVAIREFRLTRSEAAADAAGTVAIGYLRLTTSVSAANPRAFINAYISVDDLDGQPLSHTRYDIPSSDQAGPSLEIDPWQTCDPGAACEVTVRVTFHWWDYEPTKEHVVAWELEAGIAWPGIPDPPDSAEVDVELVRSLDAAVGRPASTESVTDHFVLDVPGETVVRRVRITLTADDWPQELANVQIPGYGLSSVNAVAEETGAQLRIGTDIHPADQHADRGLGGAVTLNGGAGVQAFFPFRTCVGAVPCVSDYEFEFVGPNTTSVGPIEVTWTLETILREFSSVDLPDDTSITIDILD